jgi:O-antigen ligase
MFRIGRSDRIRPIIPVVFFLSPLVASAVPRLTWLFFLLIATSLIVPALGREGAWRQLTEPNAPLVALLLLLLYVFLNATWAVDRGVAIGKASLLLGIVLITFVASSAVANWDESNLRFAALAFVTGVFLGALFVLFEMLTQGALTRFAMNSIALLYPGNPKHMRISEGQVTEISLSELNQNVAILMFNLWPGLLSLKKVAGGTTRAVLISLFLLAVIVPVILSEHQSSQVALFGSLFIFSLAWMWRSQVIRTLAIVWCLGFVFALPLSLFASKADLHLASWWPRSFQHRLNIWEYTAERVLDAPWLGIGADSTSALVRQQRETTKQTQRSIEKPGWHAHSVFFQSWYELGITGALLIALAGAALVLRIFVLPVDTQPFAAAAFSTFATIAAFAWGMWQTWLMCAVALMVLYFSTAVRASGGLPGPRRGPKVLHAIGEHIANGAAPRW